MLNSVAEWLGGLHRFTQSLFEAICRDLFGIYLMVTVERRIALMIKREEVLADLFRALVRKQPNKPCIIFNGETWTFQNMEDFSNKIASLFMNKFGLKKGDCVALFMENQPEYVATWLGLSKIGVISALINTNLKSQPLAHSINVAKPKMVIYSNSLEAALEGAKESLEKEIELMPMSATERKMSVEELLRDVEAEVVEPSEKVTPNDVIMYIYTSGTTGLPKPAVIKQSRYCAGGITFFRVASFRKDDILYITLPLYHANGGIIGMGAALVSGATVVLRNKFSASNFWKDCIEYKCTIFIYVGEICRFLVNQPASPLDRQHSVRKALGNGLRENVWREFYNRFNVKCVEFYAASEGNCTMVNITSKIGACGFAPLVNRLFGLLPARIIRVDQEMNVVRDKRGFCVECEPGEKGLLVGIIGNTAKTSYSGYANNSQASNKKIVENVFKKGQRAFDSGDLMVSDSFGYMYFCDRLGDTFRWRGENVATVEVENVLSRALDSAHVVVYGVPVPGQEGKAGMAAIVAPHVDLDALMQQMQRHLPAYARPLFIRLVGEVEQTGSFKTKKLALVEQAYDVQVIAEPVFYLEAKRQKYETLTIEIFENILNGNLKF